ncbi:MAG: HEAT repeat domain-containing protein [Saprospirales bacterium]|nr:HEAT repeat domain-containing protein [Saprospirales bacterium]
MEALGKCGSAATLEQMSSVVTYRNTDTLLLLGQARGITGSGFGDPSERGTKRMVDLALQPAYPASARLMAANYLARAAKIPLDTFAGPLAQSAPTEPDPWIRMALATALGKVKRPVAIDTLVSWYAKKPTTG